MPALAGIGALGRLPKEGGRHHGSNMSAQRLWNESLKTPISRERVDWKAFALYRKTAKKILYLSFDFGCGGGKSLPHAQK